MYNTSKELTEAFERYNNEAFGGSLTGWTVETMPVRKTFKGDCDEAKYRIRVTMSEDWTETLLHEMCHASVGCDHGHDETWKAEVRRVSKATGIAINLTPYGGQNDEVWQSNARTEIESWIKELKARKSSPTMVTRALDELTFLRKRKLLTADEYKGYKSQIMAYTR